MKHQIGGFAEQGFITFREGGNRGFHAFLADSLRHAFGGVSFCLVMLQLATTGAEHMNARMTLTTLVIGLAVAATQASAQESTTPLPGPGAMPTFQDFDLNEDGKITEEEFNEARAARIADRAQKGYPMRGLASASSFADIDTNHDGALSSEEFAAHQAAHRQPGGRRQQ